MDNQHIPTKYKDKYGVPISIGDKLQSQDREIVTVFKRGECVCVHGEQYPQLTYDWCTLADYMLFTDIKIVS